MGEGRIGREGAAGARVRSGATAEGSRPWTGAVESVGDLNDDVLEAVADLGRQLARLLALDLEAIAAEGGEGNNVDIEVPKGILVISVTDPKSPCPSTPRSRPRLICMSWP